MPRRDRRPRRREMRSSRGAMRPAAVDGPGGSARHNLSWLLLDARLGTDLAGRPALRAGAGEVSYAELARRTWAAAGWLSEEGVRRGDRLLLCLPDSPDWIAVFLGAARIGAVCALASPALAPSRLRDAAGRLEARAVLADGPWDARGARVLSPASAGEAIARGVDDPGPAAVRAHDPAYLLLTSGSSGASRWAVHRAGDIPACIATYGRRVLRLRPGDTTWSVAALPTSYGLGNSCYFPLGAGACAALATADRSPAACGTACAEQGVTALLGVPTWWARLARHVADGRVPRRAFGAVRLAVSAGEHLPAAVWHAVERTTGLRLVNGLGSSEMSNLYLSDRAGAPRAGTAGWPVPGYEVRVDGEGAGADEGELVVRGPTTMAAYHGDPEATARALDGGWLHTGDLVRRERDGSHTFLGRASDRFKAGAFWVDPGRVRDALAAQEGVGAAIALSIHDGQGLQRVGAAVVPRPGAPRGLRGHLAALAARTLAPHEVPRALIVLPVLPTTASGKVDRTELRRLLEEAVAGAPAGGREPVA